MITHEVSEALKQVLPALEKHNVQVLVIGGLAVGHYGHHRISGGPVKGDIKADLDFWYNPTTENYVNLVKALKDLDVDTSELEHLIKNKQAVNRVIDRSDIDALEKQNKSRGNKDVE